MCLWILPSIRYLRTLEQTVIDCLEQHEIVGTRSSTNTGVWIGDNKICAIGITASRWITMHGIAINVNCNLEHFSHIIPCGISAAEKGVCSLDQYARKQQLDISTVSQTLQKSFAKNFNVVMEPQLDPLHALNDLLSRSPFIDTLQLPYSTKTSSTDY
jgi:lipoate-protein ligase B